MNIVESSVLENAEASYSNLCKKCNKVLEEGHAYELGGGRWHLECFRCSSCNTQLDCTTNLLVLGNGSLICSNCSYHCTVCNKKIQDLAILTGDHAFCSSCFCCRNCKKKIDDLQYARTSQGIFCMNCHQTLLARKKRAAALKALNGNSQTFLPHSSSSSSGVSMKQSNSQHSHTSAHQSSQSINHSNTSLPLVGPNFPAAPSNVPTHSYTPRRTSSSFKEKSLPSLPTEESSPPSLPLSQNPQSHQLSNSNSNNNINSNLLNRSSSCSNSSLKANLSNTVPGQNVMSPPIRPTKQPAFDPALARIPQRSLPLSSASRSVSSSSDPNQTVSSFGAGTKSGPVGSIFPTSLPNDSSSSSVVSASNFSPVEPYNSSITNPSSSVSSATTAVNNETKPDYLVNQCATPHSLTQNNFNQALLGKNVSSSSNSNTFETPYSLSPDVKDLGDISDANSSSATISNNEQNNQVPSIPLETLHTSSPLARGGMYAENSSNSFVGESSVEESSTNDHQSKNASVSNTRTRQASVDGSSKTGGSDPLFNTLRKSDPSSFQSLLPKIDDRNIHHRSISETQMGYPNSVTSEGNGTPALTNTHSNASSTTSGSYQTVNSPSSAIRELCEAKARIVELEQQLSARENSRNIDSSINEKRKTIAGLEAKNKVAQRELQLLAEAISSKDNLKDSRDNIVSSFTTDLSNFKQSLQAEVESLILERDRLYEERDRLVLVTTNLTNECAALEERHLQVTCQVNQLHDLHIELAKQAMQKFGPTIQRPLQPGGAKEEDTYEEATPHVIDVSTDDKKDRVHGRRFWKRPTAAMAKGVKGFNKVFAQDQSHQFVTTGPYVDSNAGVNVSIHPGTGHFEDDAPGSTEANENAPDITSILTATGALGSSNSNTNNSSNNNNNNNNTPKPRNGWFNKTNSNETATSAPAASSTDPSTLMGTEIEQRVVYERTDIPLIVTRCLKEVELRGMDYEGVYRKSGGHSQVSSIEDAFEKHSNGDDPKLIDEALSGDISGVTSAVKQYLRHLPRPLVTFEMYNDFVEASKQIGTNIDTATEMIRTVVNTLPPSHKKCLRYVCLHLKKVSKRSDINLMTSRNLAVVFAPTLVRHTNGEREIHDMIPRNDGTQLMIDRCNQVFADVVLTPPPPSPLRQQNQQNQQSAKLGSSATNSGEEENSGATLSSSSSTSDSNSASNSGSSSSKNKPPPLNSTLSGSSKIYNNNIKSSSTSNLSTVSHHHNNNSASNLQNLGSSNNNNSNNLSNSSGLSTNAQPHPSNNKLPQHSNNKSTTGKPNSKPTSNGEATAALPNVELSTMTNIGVPASQIGISNPI